MRIQNTPFGRNPFKRGVAIITAALFLFTGIPTAFSQPNNLKVQGGNPSKDLSRLVRDAEIRIPPELGRIDESFRGTSGKTILYIQDAHDSLEAQENIAKIINHLVANDGVKTVFEEGYEGPVPTDKYFGFIKDPKIKEKVSYFLMDHLRVGGAEYSHINRTKEFNLIGADSLKLHKENVDQYCLSAAKKDTITKDLKAVEKELKSLVDSRFPKELKEWLKTKRQFDTKKLDLFTYLGRTMPLLGKHGAEKGLGLISFILEASRSNDPAVIEKAKHIDAREVFSELIKLEQAVAEIFLHDMADKQLFEYYKILSLLNRLNELQVSQEEYEAVKTSLKEFDTDSFARFIFRQAPKTLILSRMWERNIKDAIRFYEIAAARDGALSGAFGRYFSTGIDTKMSVLVYGGFHKENIKRILEAKGISYLVVSPRITKSSSRHEAFYKQLMSKGMYKFEVPLNLRFASRVLPIFAFANGINEVRAIESVIKRGMEPAMAERYLLNTSRDIPAVRSEVRVQIPGTSIEVSVDWSEHRNSKGQQLKILKVYLDPSNKPAAIRFIATHLNLKLEEMAADIAELLTEYLLAEYKESLTEEGFQQAVDKALVDGNYESLSDPDEGWKKIALGMGESRSTIFRNSAVPVLEALIESGLLDMLAITSKFEMAKKDPKILDMLLTRLKGMNDLLFEGNFEGESWGDAEEDGIRWNRDAEAAAKVLEKNEELPASIWSREDDARLYVLLINMYLEGFSGGFVYEDSWLNATQGVEQEWEEEVPNDLEAEREGDLAPEEILGEDLNPPDDLNQPDNEGPAPVGPQEAGSNLWIDQNALWALNYALEVAGKIQLPVKIVVPSIFEIAIEILNAYDSGVSHGASDEDFEDLRGRTLADIESVKKYLEDKPKGNPAKWYCLWHLINKYPEEFKKLQIDDNLKHFVRRLMEKGNEIPEEERNLFVGGLWSKLSAYENKHKDVTYKEMASWMSVVGSNFGLVIDALNNLGLSFDYFNPLRESLSFNNPLTRIIRMLGEPKNVVDGYLDVSLKMTHGEQFDWFFSEVVLPLARDFDRRAPQQIAGALAYLRIVDTKNWKQKDFIQLQKDIRAYFELGIKALVPELFIYFVKNKDKKEKIQELAQDSLSELGDIQWGQFKGLSDAFIKKYHITPVGELALIARYVPISNQSAADYSTVYRQIKKFMHQKSADWQSEVAVEFRRRYQFAGTRGVMEYHSPNANRKQLHDLVDKLTKYAVDAQIEEGPTFETIVDDILAARDASTEHDKKAAVLRYTQKARSLNLKNLTQKPLSDEELYVWFSSWLTVLQDTWKVDLAPSLREQIRSRISALSDSEFQALLKAQKMDRMQFFPLNDPKPILPKARDLLGIFTDQKTDEEAVNWLTKEIVSKFSMVKGEALLNESAVEEFIEKAVAQALKSAREEALRNKMEFTKDDEARVGKITNQALGAAVHAAREALKGQSDSDRLKTIVSDKIAKFITNIFSNDIVAIQKEMTFFIRHERISEDHYEVGFFDDALHLMAFMMTGVCTWPDRPRQIQDNRYHFGKLAVKDQNGRLQGVSQVQLTRGHIQNIPARHSEQGWSVMALPGINLFNGEIGMSTEKAVQALLETAQRRAKADGLEGAVIPVSTEIHSNQAPVKKVIETFAARGWLRKAMLDQATVLSEGGHPYSYQEVYLIEIPESEFFLTEAKERLKSEDEQVEEALKSSENEDLIDKFIWIKKEVETARVQQATQEALLAMPPSTISLIQNASFEKKMKVLIVAEVEREESIVVKSKNEAVLKLGRDILYAPGMIEPVLFKLKLAQLLCAVWLKDYDVLLRSVAYDENAFFKLALVQNLLLYKDRLSIYHYFLHRNQWTPESGNFLHTQTLDARENILKQHARSLNEFNYEIPRISQWNVFINLLNDVSPDFVVSNYLELLMGKEEMNAEEVGDILQRIASVPVTQEVSIAKLREVYREFMLGQDVVIATATGKRTINRYQQFDQSEYLSKYREIITSSQNKNEFYGAVREALKNLLPDALVDHELVALVDRGEFFESKERSKYFKNLLTDLWNKYFSAEVVRAFDENMKAIANAAPVPLIKLESEEAAFNENEKDDPMQKLFPARSEVRESVAIELPQANIPTTIMLESRLTVTQSRAMVNRAWQILRLKQDVIAIVEQSKIDALSPEMFKELLEIAGLNNGKLHLVIPDALQGKYSARVAELRKIASIYYGFPRLAASDKIPVIGFSDMEHDTLAAFQRRLDPRLVERMRDSAFGLNQAGSFGVGILYALKDIPADQLPLNPNGFRYDRSGWYSAQILEVLQAYTVISTSA